MKKSLAILAVLGWFFLVRVPHPELPGIKITALIGIFKTEKECIAEYENLVDLLAALPGALAAPCELSEEI